MNPFVVRGRIVLGETIGTIIFAGSTVEVKLTLKNVIFNPKEIHIYIALTLR